MVRDGQTARRTPADGCHFNARRLERVQGRVEGPFLNAEDILRGPMDGVGDRRNPCMSSALTEGLEDQHLQGARHTKSPEMARPINWSGEILRLSSPVGQSHLAVHAEFGVWLLDIRQLDCAVVPRRCAIVPEAPPRSDALRRCVNDGYAGKTSRETVLTIVPEPRHRSKGSRVQGSKRIP